jgi:hypothetical protein
MLDEAEYKKEYDKAAAELEAAANPTTAEPKPDVVAEVKTEAAPEVKAELEKPVDPLTEIREKLEKTEKALKDTQAWGTRNAQDLAEIKRTAAEQRRAAERPQILDANPELEAAIRYVAPQAQEPSQSNEWQQVIDKAHPGIFDKSIDPELEAALMTRLSALGDEIKDPLVAIREITAEKIAHAERMIGKRFAVESAKAAQKSAMSMPGAGSNGSRTAPIDSDLAAVERIQNMTPAEFERERRKVMGY